MYFSITLTTSEIMRKYIIFLLIIYLDVGCTLAGVKVLPIRGVPHLVLPLRALQWDPFVLNTLQPAI